MIEIICWFCGSSYSGHQAHNAKEAPDVETSLEDNACRGGSACRYRLRVCANLVWRPPNGHARPNATGRHDGSMHSQMMQGQGGCKAERYARRYGRSWRHARTTVRRTGVPTMPGQDAFGTIQEVVQILQADPATDWSKVNIGTLRQHLIDMNEVTLHAAAAERVVENGVEITVTGEGRTLEAIKRMVPAHVNELREIGWNAKSDELPNGIKLTVMASEAQPLTKLKALGFMGIMVQGSHHQPHHLMMAKGQFAMH